MSDPLLVTSTQLSEKLGVSLRTLWRMVARGDLPHPIRYNRKLVRWKTEDIERYIRESPTSKPENHK